MTDRIHFDRFTLDRRERRLTNGGAPVDLNTRYFDALDLLLREPGSLISKDRFMTEVWHGVPVTDEALTQCVRTLRQRLGDDAARPRFIETVPKHGYRFIASIEQVTLASAQTNGSPRRFLILTGAGTVGGGLAGLIGGVCYGFLGATQPLQPGMGAASVLLVLMCVTMLAALTGGAGVSGGVAAADAASGRLWRWSILGGAAGGMAVGAVAKLLGLDAFALLLGQSPGDITGGAEGLALGGAVGLGGWLAHRFAAGSLRGGMACAALAGGIGGALIVLAGGRLMGGSLASLARSLPASRLRLEPVGALFGERGFGPLSQAMTGAIEGALFAACVVGALILTERALDR